MKNRMKRRERTVRSAIEEMEQSIGMIKLNTGTSARPNGEAKNFCDALVNQ